MRKNGKWTDDDWVSSMPEINRPSIYSKFHLIPRCQSDSSSVFRWGGCRVGAAVRFPSAIVLALGIRTGDGDDDCGDHPDYSKQFPTIVTRKTV